MKLRPEPKLMHEHEGRHISGQFLSDDGSGIESGWVVKTWTSPGSPHFWQAEHHWVPVGTAKVHGYVPLNRGVHSEADIDADRKAFILSTIALFDKRLREGL